MATHMQVITDNLDLWTSALLTKSTAGRGSNGRVEAYGIKKLRELILELAVRGKLVPQDLNDEPASVLLARIAEEKKRLARERKIKTQKPLLEINEQEKLFLSPVGWEWVRLGRISEANTGYAFKSTEYTESGTFVLRVTNINPDGSINQDDKKYIDSVAAVTTYEKFKLNTCDVLLVMVGGSLGKLGIVSEDCLPAVLNQNMWKLDRFGGIPVEFFLVVLKYINGSQLKVTSSTHGHLAQGEYMDKLVPLPPLAEQHRIVAKVDELMALCDQLEQQQNNSIEAHQTLVETLLGTLTNVASQQELNEAWPRIFDHFDTLFTTEQSIDQLKQTILQLAVMGKLVPQDPNDEPASVLLEKIEKDKKQLIRDGKFKKDAQITPVGEKFKLPTNWASIVVQDFADVRLGSTPSRTEPKYWNGDIRWVSSGEVANCIIQETSEKITKKGFDNSSVSLIPKRSVLIAIIGQGKTRGQSAILNIDACTNQNVAALVFNMNFVVPEFVWLWAKSNYESHRGDGRGGAQPALNGKMVRGFRFYLPPTEEQHRIVAKVDELMALCDALKARLAAAQTTQVHLADAIVEQAVA